MNPGPGGFDNWPPTRLSPTLSGPTDAYKPREEQVAFQAQHTAEVEQEEAAAGKGRRSLVGRLRSFLRRLF